MHRVISIALILMVYGCGTDQKRQNRVQSLDSDAQTQPVEESFDLQVKKYEDPGRQNWQDPKFVIQALGNLQEKTIADIGSGTGYFTFQLAVPAKKVIAIDVEQRFLNYIEDRKTEMYDRELAAKIETRLAQPNDPVLAANEVDLVLIVNTITFINDRHLYLSKVREGLTDGGKIIIVDYELGKMPVGPGDQLKIHQDEIKKELQVAGFAVESIDTSSLQYQYVIKAGKIPK